MCIISLVDGIHSEEHVEQTCTLFVMMMLMMMMMMMMMIVCSNISITLCTLQDKILKI